MGDIRNIKEGRDHVTTAGEIIPNSELTLAPFRQRSYAYLSDTVKLNRVPDQLKGVTLLFHEATFLDKDTDLARQTFHSTAKEAAAFAREAGAGKLLIGHFSTRYKNDELFVQEARSVFPNTVAVSDGDRFTIELERQARLE